MRYFDVHTHLNFSQYEPDNLQEVQRALAEGVWLVNVGTHVQTSEKALVLAEATSEGVWATVGYHPAYVHIERVVLNNPPAQIHQHGLEEDLLIVHNQEVSVHTDFEPETFLKLASHPRVAAVGEAGLDYYRIDSRGDQHEVQILKGKQKEIFLQHIEIANLVHKPLMVHCRSQHADDAYVDAFELLQDYPPLHGFLIHFFGGSKAVAEKLLDLGGYFSFGGALTFANGEHYRELVRFIPLDQLTTETDAPYVTPEPHRDKLNHPVYVKLVVESIVQVRGQDAEEVREKLFENARRFFRV